MGQCQGSPCCPGSNERGGMVRRGGHRQGSGSHYLEHTNYPTASFVPPHELQQHQHNQTQQNSSSIEGGGGDDDGSDRSAADQVGAANNGRIGGASSSASIHSGGVVTSSRQHSQHSNHDNRPQTGVIPAAVRVISSRRMTTAPDDASSKNPTSASASASTAPYGHQVHQAGQYASHGATRSSSSTVAASSSSEPLPAPGSCTKALLSALTNAAQQQQQQHHDQQQPVVSFAELLLQMDATFNNENIKHDADQKKESMIEVQQQRLWRQNPMLLSSTQLNLKTEPFSAKRTTPTSSAPNGSRTARNPQASTKALLIGVTYDGVDGVSDHVKEEEVVPPPHPPSSTSPAAASNTHTPSCPCPSSSVLSSLSSPPRHSRSGQLYNPDSIDGVKLMATYLAHQGYDTYATKMRILVDDQNLSSSSSSNSCKNEKDESKINSRKVVKTSKQNQNTNDTDTDNQHSNTSSSRSSRSSGGCFGGSATRGGGGTSRGTPRTTTSRKNGIRNGSGTAASSSCSSQSSSYGHGMPTAANIISGMRWLTQDVRPGDSLFLYYAGHGAGGQFDNKSSLENQQQQQQQEEISSGSDSSDDESDDEEEEEEEEALLPLDFGTAGAIRADFADDGSESKKQAKGNSTKALLAGDMPFYFDGDHEQIKEVSTSVATGAADATTLMKLSPDFNVAQTIQHVQRVQSGLFNPHAELVRILPTPPTVNPPNPTVMSYDTTTTSTPPHTRSTYSSTSRIVAGGTASAIQQQAQQACYLQQPQGQQQLQVQQRVSAMPAAPLVPSSSSHVVSSATTTTTTYHPVHTSTSHHNMFTHQHNSSSSSLSERSSSTNARSGGGGGRVLADF